MNCAGAAFVIFDTDVLVWIERGNLRAVAFAEGETERFISAWTYMELLQGAPGNRGQQTIKNYLREYEFKIFPLNESIGHQAIHLIERYAAGRGLRAGDALVAATAVEHGQMLCSANAKHFRPIKELTLKLFRP